MRIIMTKINRLGASFILTIQAVLLALGNLHADQLGGQAGSFLWMGLGADRVAMGDCGTGMLNNNSAWYYNPAGLPYLVDRKVSLGYRSMALDRSIMHIGFATPIYSDEGLDAGLGVGLVRAGTDEIDGRNSNGEHFDWLSYSDNLIYGSFALKPHEMLTVGITIKWIIGAIPDIKPDNSNLYSYAMGLDFGMLFQPRKDLRFGFQLRDINARYNWESSEVWGDSNNPKEDKLPNLIRIGASWDAFRTLILAADLVINPNDIGEDSNDFNPTFGKDNLDAFEPHCGIEWKYALNRDQGFILRTGYNGEAPTFGLGFILKINNVRTRLDYAFVMEQVAPSGSHLIGWMFEL